MHNSIIPELPFVSIIVPVYNAQDSLVQCIQSLIDLDYPKERRELVFINNNSIDSSQDILEKYSRHIKILNEKKQGAAAARNAGIVAATHELIAFIDADCLADKDWLKKLIFPLVADSRITAVGGKILTSKQANYVEKYGQSIHDHERAIKSIKPPYLITMNMAVRKKALVSVGMFDESFLRGQDVDLAYRLYESGYKFLYVEEAQIFHRNEASLSGLFREGFTHGLWTVRLRKKFGKTLFKGRSRIHYKAYAKIASNIHTLLFRKQDKAGQARCCCDLVFTVAKRLGALCGSIKFQYFSL